MAKVSVLQFSDGRFLIYTVNSAVGPGAPNRRDDVLLVQYFLREAFKGSPTFQKTPFTGVVNVDGVAGPQTFAAILHFQKVTKSLGVPISTDGRVDAPIGEQSAGSISHTAYTIIRLNQAYSSARPGDISRVATVGDCPAELRELVKAPTFVK